jgi:cytidylate kinase
MRREPVITIDGPAGAGKSTVARKLAERLGYRYLETGAMYRAMAWKVRSAGVGAEAGEEFERVVRSARIEITPSGRVIADGRDITEAVRSPEIGRLASSLSALPVVREVLTRLQRQVAEEGGVVLEGRDTGSVVAPDAEVKFYLDASLQARAERRAHDLAGQGRAIETVCVTRELSERDRADSSRSLAPLVRPKGAHYVDSSTLSPDTVVELMLREVERVRCSTKS